MSVKDIVQLRHSVRAFKADPVSRTDIEDLIERACRSPSGGNLQPWEITVVTGEARDAAAQAGLKAIMANPAGEDGDYPVYPPGLNDPWRTRRTESGEAMYEALGISRDDKMARLQWLTRNFDFFGAPVGIFLSIDKAMGHSQWAHMGMFAQTFALLAVEKGLGVCMQEAWAKVRVTMHTHLGLDADKVLWCGIALGYADEAAPVNRFRTDRAPLDEIVTFRDKALTGQVTS